MSDLPHDAHVQARDHWFLPNALRSVSLEPCTCADESTLVPNPHFFRPTCPRCVRFDALLDEYRNTSDQLLKNASRRVRCNSRGQSFTGSYGVRFG